MKNLLRNTGRAVRMGLLWAVVWAPIAVVIGAYIIDPDNSMDEMWVAVGAYPAFLCGVTFFALRQLTEGRRLQELSLPRVAVLGAVSGLLVGVLPLVLGTPRTGLGGFLILGALTLLSSVSAVGSVLLNVGGTRRIDRQPVTTARRPGQSWM